MKLHIALVAVTTSVIAGCGPSKVHVAGRLEWADGKPAAELVAGQVIFESAETKTSARGIISKEGTFHINTEMKDDGILPGKYRVAIVEHRPAPEGVTQVPPQHLPDRYYSFESSGLTATVTTGSNEIVLKLDRMPAKK